VSIVILFCASSAAASTIQYTLDPGATLQLGAGPLEVLTGGLTIECPATNCISFGEVDFEIVSIDLHSLSFDESQSGAFIPVENSDGIGFGLGRFLTLIDAGALSQDPNKDASLSYGFDPVLDSSTTEFDRYRVWILYGQGTYTGPFVPDTFAMQLILEETIIDLGPLGVLGWNVVQTAQVEFSATPVPEPSTALLMGIGLIGLATLRRAASAEI